MPKPIQPPALAYGSPEWKAERTRMVGTPEWKAATGYVESSQQGGRLTAALPFAPYGTTLTTAEKQAQSPLYNPLYDPSSHEYQTNLVNISQPRRPVQSPLVQNPLLQPTNAPVTPQIPQLQPQPQGPVAPQQQTPQVTLPEAFQQNYNMGPSTTPTNQGIKMPNINRQGFGGGSNWTDFLTVAHNRQTR